MQRSLPASTTIVIDANVAVWVLLPALAGAAIDAPARFAEWRRAGVQLAAPTLFMAECTSAIRGAVYSGTLTTAEGQAAITDLFMLPVVLLPLTVALCLATFDWAGRLGRRKAYDAFYLALSAELNVDFWSADRHLVNAARQAGMARAHWIGEN